MCKSDKNDLWRLKLLSIGGFEMWRVFLVVCLSAPLISGRGSPHSEELESIFNRARYSDNVFEDANLDVPGLIQKYRYPLEIHNVVTEDGYILEVHRIPHGRDRNNVPDARKPVIFLMHGLLCSSADWVIMGPGSGLAYILAEEGYDVWMGNARGNHYSRNHLTLNPNGILNTKFWEFSWDEIGVYDLPAMIDYALANSGQSRLHYIGHSQGTTAFFVMGSMRPEYNAKIISMHAMAPVAFMAHNRNPLLWFISPFSTSLEKMASLFGIGEFLPNTQIMTWAGEALCRDEVVFQPLCSNILFLIGGWNEAQHNSTMMPVIFGHTPAGSSVRQFAHYGQSIANKGFQRYDYGSWIANRRVYGSIRPPSYDLAKVSTAVFLHYSDRDPLAEVADVDTLWRQLGRPIGKFRVPDGSFSHLDFLWGIDAQELVYNRIINLVKAMDINGLSAVETAMRNMDRV